MKCWGVSAKGLRGCSRMFAQHLPPARSSGPQSSPHRWDQLRAKEKQPFIPRQYLACPFLRVSPKPCEDSWALPVLPLATATTFVQGT